MGRTPKPWWREDRQAYYANVRGVCHKLGTSLKQANQVLKDLLRQPETKPVCSDSVAVILDDFLEWTEQNRSPKTYRGYKDFLQSFMDTYPRLRTQELNAGHVTVWLNDRKTWNSTTKRNAITALQRGLNWAVKNRGLERNPIHGMEKPKAKTRTETLTLVEFKTILRHTPDREFRWLLEFCWDCGCRPQEAKGLRAEWIDLEKRRCVIPGDEGKGGRTRAIYLATERSVRIVKRLMQQEGPIFRNTRGNPWTASAVKCRFAAMEEKLGRRYTQYAFRHTWITRKLLAGVDSHLVASLAGHVSSQMIDTVYSHVADDYKFMLEAAARETLQKGH